MQFTPFFLIFNCIGLLNFTTLNCISKLNDGTCVINAQRGQPVTLCIGRFTIPSTIPQGKHVIGINESYWSVLYSNPPVRTYPLYRCENGYCEEWPNNYYVNYSNFLNVTDSCLTVNTVNNIGAGVTDTHYKLRVYFDARGAIQLLSRDKKFSVPYYKGNSHQYMSHECM